MIRLAMVACVLLVAGCGNQSPHPTPARVDVGFRYDEMTGKTWTELDFPLDADGTARARTIDYAEGELAPPLPTSARGVWFTVIGAGDPVVMYAMADGERFEFTPDRNGDFGIKSDALLAMATGTDVRVRVGMIEGPLPPESKRAIAEYLALFE